MTKKHFEFLADWIARNTIPSDAPGGATRAVDRREYLVACALALIAFDGNVRFDRARFEAKVEELVGRYV